MTRALILFVGVLGAALPLWALGTYPVEDAFSRVLVGVILSGLAVGTIGLFLRARVVDRLLTQAAAFESSGHDTEKLAQDGPELFRFVDAKLRGERVRMERGEAIARYLVSALVLVGLLGTFVGLVDALVGARDALGVSSDVTALRGALLAPMKGLSRAFGTSVAGIAASAMLGLAAVMIRRGELRVQDAIDRAVSGPLKDKTLASRQVVALERLGLLGETLPAAVERMAEVASQLPTLERSFVDGHQALADALKSSVEKAAADVRDALERGIASATKAHDDLVESAVKKASAVLEERAVALAKILDEGAKERQAAEKKWHESLSSQTRSVLDTLDASVKAQAERWEASTASLAKSADDKLGALLSLEEERASSWHKQLEERDESDRAREERLQSLLEKASSVAERAAAAAGSHADDLARFLKEQQSQDRALVSELKAFLDERREDDKELVVELRAFLDARRADDKNLTAEMRGFLDERKGDDTTLTHEMRTLFESRRDDDRSLASDMRAFVEGQKEADRAVIGELRGFLEEQRGAEHALVERLQSFAEEMKAADRALIEEMRTFLRDEKGQALAFSDDIRAQLEGWLAKAAERDDMREAARVALEEKLAAERQALAADVVTHLEAHAGAVRDEVVGLKGSVEGGADALLAGGIELTALADRFASAVSAFKEANREQLDRFGALEINLTTGGADSERERFGAYLDQTREVFERSLEVQRELFQGLKALQSERLEVPEDGADVVAEAGPLTQPNADA